MSKRRGLPFELPSRAWVFFLGFALFLGVCLRMIWTADMEYKADEHYMFQRLMLFGSEPWNWLGMPSGVYIRNPGLSVWVFIALGKLFQVTTPVGLCRAVQALNSVALVLLLPFCCKLVPEKDREPWFWAIALLAVNPFAIAIERKLWAQSVLPFFVLLFLVCWWKRDRSWGAFFWGLIGAALGQIHMSGFFFAAAFVCWALLFDRRRPRWRAWFVGSCFGAWPLIPWFVHNWSHPTGQPLIFGWGEAVQLKYWVFWFSDALGMHLGNLLGVHRGNSPFQQLTVFARYPLIGGTPTYLMAAVHVLVPIVGFWILGRGLAALWKRRSEWKALIIGRKSETAFTQNAALWGYGLIITLPTIAIRRYYLVIVYPLKFVWLARMALAGNSLRAGRALLLALFVLEFMISATFLHFVHVNGGALDGDYGLSWKMNPVTRP